MGFVGQVAPNFGIDNMVLVHARAGRRLFARQVK